MKCEAGHDYRAVVVETKSVTENKTTTTTQKYDLFCQKCGEKKGDR